MKHTPCGMIAAVILWCAAWAAPAFAEKTPVPGLYQYTLDNGLALFVAENHAVPLAYIEIAVRAGGVNQTPETAGLFHLYEHMMFKGNELYPDAASVQRALSSLGVANWNGTTGTDRVNYFFTIPADQLESGLAFWNAAIRTPLMDAQEFENEKKVVLSEIEGNAADPGHILRYYANCRLFPDAPYRTDPAGSVPVVRNATIAQMRDMQSKYYIPANAALFVGGDVEPDGVYRLVQKIYGTWGNNGNSRPSAPPQQSRSPFAGAQFAVMPYDQLPPQQARVRIQFRGPDTDYDIEDTYAADYLATLLADPDGLFKRALAEDASLAIPAGSYVSGHYSTVRASGTYDFSAVLRSPEDGLPGRARRLLERIQGEILPALAADASLYAPEAVASVSDKLAKEDMRTSETASGLLSNLSFWWSRTSPEYYFSYNRRMAEVTQEDVAAFVATYFTGASPLVTVLVNPDVYEATRGEYAAAGFAEAGAADAFWWKEERFAPDPAKVALETGTPQEDAPVYRPAARTGGAPAPLRAHEVQEGRLRNGIPVYVRRMEDARVDSVYIAVRGGVEHLEPATSGLERALFSMMARSSESFSYDERQALTYRTNSSFAAYSRLSGSALYVDAIDSELPALLPALADGFLHPDYDEKVFANLLDDCRRSVQSMLNDPRSLLDYEAAKAVYAGHPYAVRASVTPDSLENITIENMRALHGRLVDPAAIFVVAVGNVDMDFLVRELDKTLGQLPGGVPPKLLHAAAFSRGRYVPKPVPPAAAGGSPVLLTHPNAQGTGHVYRVFAAPPLGSGDYAPALLAASIYSQIMFNVVRERRGVCYTPRSYLVGSRASLGFELLYSLSDYGGFAAAMREARNVMAGGSIIDGVDEDGEYRLSPLADGLEGFKNKLVTSTYASQATAAGVAGSLTYNLLQFDDAEAGARQVDAIRAATPEQVLEAFRRYWLDAPSRWFVVVGPEGAPLVNLDGLAP